MISSQETKVAKLAKAQKDMAKVEGPINFTFKGHSKDKPKTIYI